MATKGGPRLFNNLDHNDMVWYMDIANKDCWDSSAISSTSKLYNLANSSEYFYPQDSTYATSTHYSLSRDYIERHNNGATGDNTNWKSNVTKPRFTSGNSGEMSGFVFVKGQVGVTEGNQSGQNIYLGGWDSRISFALSGGGNSQWGGVLCYKRDGSGTLFHRTHSTTNLLDGSWRSLGWSATANGIDTVTVRLYHDGSLVSTGTYSVANDDSSLPYGNQTMIMGGWSSGYGEFSGQYNNWMYFNKELDATDFKQLHNAFKSKYGA